LLFLSSRARVAGEGLKRGRRKEKLDLPLCQSGEGGNETKKKREAEAFGEKSNSKTKD